MAWRRGVRPAPPLGPPWRRRHPPPESLCSGSASRRKLPLGLHSVRTSTAGSTRSHGQAAWAFRCNRTSRAPQGWTPCRHRRRRPRRLRQRPRLPRKQHCLQQQRRMWAGAQLMAERRQCTLHHCCLRCLHLATLHPSSWPQHASPRVPRLPLPPPWPPWPLLLPPPLAGPSALQLCSWRPPPPALLALLGLQPHAAPPPPLPQQHASQLPLPPPHASPQGLAQKLRRLVLASGRGSALGRDAPHSEAPGPSSIPAVVAQLPPPLVAAAVHQLAWSSPSAQPPMRLARPLLVQPQPSGALPPG